MSLPNTTKIDTTTENPETALAELLETNNILLFIIGNSEAISDWVQIADQLAPTSPTGINRKVVWIVNHNILNEQLEIKLSDSGSDISYDQVLSFCLTLLPNRTAHTILDQNSQLGYVVLEHLYIEAESHS